MADETSLDDIEKLILERLKKPAANRRVGDETIRGGAEDLERQSTRLQSSVLPATVGALFTNTPGVAKSGAALTKSLEAVNKAQATPGGVYLPGEGKFVGSPMYEDDKAAGAQEGLLKALAAVQSRKEAAALAAKAKVDAAALIAAARAGDRGPLDELRRLRADELRRKEEEKKRGKPLSPREQTDMLGLGDSAAAVDKLAETFKDEFADNALGVSAVGKAKNFIAAEAPGVAPEAWKDAQKWRADLSRLKEFKERHALFGATLTGNEKTAWEQVTPPQGASAADIRQWLKKQKELLGNSIQWHGEMYQTQGSNPEAIVKATRGKYKPIARPTASDDDDEELKAIRKALGE